MRLPSTCVKSQTWQYMPRILVVGKQRQGIPEALWKTCLAKLVRVRFSERSCPSEVDCIHKSQVLLMVSYGGRRNWWDTVNPADLLASSRLLERDKRSEWYSGEPSRRSCLGPNSESHRWPCLNSAGYKTKNKPVNWGKYLQVHIGAYRNRGERAGWQNNKHKVMKKINFPHEKIIIRNKRHLMSIYHNYMYTYVHAPKYLSPHEQTHTEDRQVHVRTHTHTTHTQTLYLFFRNVIHASVSLIFTSIFKMD